MIKQSTIIYGLAGVLLIGFGVAASGTKIKDPSRRIPGLSGSAGTILEIEREVIPTIRISAIEGVAGARPVQLNAEAFAVRQDAGGNFAAAAGLERELTPEEIMNLISPSEEAMTSAASSLSEDDARLAIVSMLSVSAVVNSGAFFNRRFYEPGDVINDGVISSSGVMVGPLLFQGAEGDALLFSLGDLMQVAVPVADFTTRTAAVGAIGESWDATQLDQAPETPAKL
ncbi:MAG: hypothetical protein AAGB19_19640 [Cyanobacteria bacterium P01_F01_bin.3]